MDASRHCARPGCLGPVTAWLSYDYGRSTAWLDPPLATGDGSHWGLCRDHADRLRVPVGWTCEDRRHGAAPSHGGPTAAPPLRVAAALRTERLPLPVDRLPGEADFPAVEADFPAVAI
jgi:hypothetical protein